MDLSLEAQFHRALVAQRRFNRKDQGYIMGAFREAVEAHAKANPGTDTTGASSGPPAPDTPPLLAEHRRFFNTIPLPAYIKRNP